MRITRLMQPTQKDARLINDVRHLKKGGNLMAKSKQEIIEDITNHFNGKIYKDCYRDITSDIDSRLFVNNNVSKENGHWIYRSASSDNVVREIEQHFLDKGMNGGSGGGDEDSKIVYAYKKTTTTNP